MCQAIGFHIFQSSTEVHALSSIDSTSIGCMFLHPRSSRDYLITPEQFLQVLYYGFHTSEGTTLTPSLPSCFSTSSSISPAVLPWASYVECAPCNKTTLKPAASAPLHVERTQHSLCMPKATIVSTRSSFS